MSNRIGDDVVRAASILKAGGLVAFPTETVYGLGANALNAAAVAKVFEAKNRPSFDPLIVHVAEIDGLSLLVQDLPTVAIKLADAFWPGPMTLVMPKTEAVPDLVTSGLPSVAVRIPDHPIAQQLLRSCELSLAAPSANPFGGVSPTEAQHVVQGLGESVDYVLDGGPCRVGVESTVVSLLEDVPTILRPGGVTKEALESVVGNVASRSHFDLDSRESREGPGMVRKHYSPKTRVDMISHDQLDGFVVEGRVGLISGQPVADDSRFERVIVLSKSGDMAEAATRLFASLREMDAIQLDLILATSFPEHGLGVALNDRLRRASTRDD